MNLDQLIKALQDVKRRERTNGDLPVIVKGITVKTSEIVDVWVNEDSIELMA